MKCNRFSVEQIVTIVKQAEMGMPVAGLIRRVGSASRRSIAGRSSAGLEIDQVRQLKQLQEEIGRLKKLVAELTLDGAMLEDVLRKNW
jgi:putative transposase